MVLHSVVLFFVRKNQTNGHSQRLLTFRRRKDKTRDDIKIFFYFFSLLLIEMTIAVFISSTSSLSVCENNIECVSFVFRCCLTPLCVGIFSSVSLLLWWGSLLSKERRLLFFSFFFLLASLLFFFASLWPQEEERVIRDCSTYIFYFKALSIRALP